MLPMYAESAVLNLGRQNHICSLSVTNARKVIATSWSYYSRLPGNHHSVYHSFFGKDFLPSAVHYPHFQAVLTSSIWSLAVCKYGGGRHGRFVHMWLRQV